MRNRILFLLLFSTVFITSSAQELVLPQLEGYKKVTDYPVFVPENLWDFINGAADVYLALGFENLHVAEYKKGKDVIKLEVYKHNNNTNAFGIYASERSSSFRFINLGGQGYSVDGSINFFEGDFYVKIRTYSKKEKTLQASATLARKVSDMLPGEAEMPSVLSLFPEQGKKKNEETYINESVLGHKFLSKAFRAVYEMGTDNFSIYIIQPETTEETYKTAETFMKSTGIEPSETDSGKYVITDGYNGTVFLAWKDKTLVLISGLSKDQAEIADNYTSGILR
jgi:hypothetical protein